MPASVSALTRLLHSASVVGVSGSRAAAPGCVRAVTWAVRQFAPGASVVTGCMSGIDQVARGLAPSALVLRAASFGRGRGRFARRSIAVVRRVAAAGRAGGGPAWRSGCPLRAVPARRASCRLRPRRPASPASAPGRGRRWLSRSAWASAPWCGSRSASRRPRPGGSGSCVPGGRVPGGARQIWRKDPCGVAPCCAARRTLCDRGGLWRRPVHTPPRP